MLIDLRVVLNVNKKFVFCVVVPCLLFRALLNMASSDVGVPRTNIDTLRKNVGVLRTLFTDVGVLLGGLSPTRQREHRELEGSLFKRSWPSWFDHAPP